MSDLASFLAWFDGFAENIDKPTPKQWDRIKTKIAELKASAPEPGMVPAAAMTPAPAQRMQKPTNKTQWISQYKGHLIEMGCDMDTATDFAAHAEVDLNRDPVEAARDAMSGFMN